MKLLFKYPTRERPAIFQQTLGKYLSLLSHKHETRFVISCDQDDESMNNAGMRAWIAERPNCTVFFNPPPQTKVTAINANLEGWQFDILVLISDDMIPQVRSYDDRIATLFASHFPRGDGVLHLDDGRAGRRLNTLPILDSKYFSRFLRIYHPAYSSVFCDNEFQAVSESLHRVAYVPEVVIRHQWLGDGPRDALMRHNESFYAVDGRTFARRQAAGFPNE